MRFSQISSQIFPDLPRSLPGLPNLQKCFPESSQIFPDPPGFLSGFPLLFPKGFPVPPGLPGFPQILLGSSQRLPTAVSQWLFLALLLRFLNIPRVCKCVPDNSSGMHCHRRWECAPLQRKRGPHSSGDALPPQLECSPAAAGMHSHCNGSVPNCSGSAHPLQQECVPTAARVRSYCSRSAFPLQKG